MINETSTSAGYFVMADSFRATNATNKDFAVNLIGKSTPANTQIMADTSAYKELRWTVTDYFGVTSNGAQASGPPYNAPTSGQVIAHIVSNRPMDVVAADTSWSIDNWGIFIQTQRMRVSVSNADRGATLTFFETGPANFASTWTVAPMSGTDFAAARINSTDGWTDWHISQTSAADVHALSAGATVSIDSGAIVSDAQYAYLRRVGSTLDSAMISRGTTLSSEGEPHSGNQQPRHRVVPVLEHGQWRNSRHAFDGRLYRQLDPDLLRSAGSDPEPDLQRSGAEQLHEHFRYAAVGLRSR